VIGAPYTRREGKGCGLSRRDGCPAAWGVRRGFNLVELVIVLAVAVVLTGLMLPAMSRVRENLHRIICSSNLRQLGMSVIAYADERNSLPYTALLLGDPPQPQELMAAYLGGEPAGWDGLGLLYSENYCKAPGVFYCPSHTGDHPSERYLDRWDDDDLGSEPIYSNYHYAGHMEWGDTPRLRVIDDALLVIATDGLRTTRDFNHVTGMNVLSGDGSVIWRDDHQMIYSRLPHDSTDEPDLATFSDLWQDIQDLTHHR
jgi:prepilin-type N-terminal cleavage/methylation domain-containing protein